MLIVAGTITIEPGKRDAFLQARASSITATRSEPGCIEYAFSADALDADTVRVFERWESKDALDTHLGVLANAKPEPGAPAIKVTGADIIRYDISGSAPLGV